MDPLLVRLVDRLRRHVEGELPWAVGGRLGGDKCLAVLPGVDAAAAEAIGCSLAAVSVDEVGVGRRTMRVSALIISAMLKPPAAGERATSLIAGRAAIAPVGNWAENAKGRAAC